MRVASCPRVAAAIGAACLAALAGFRGYADAAYRTGLGYTDQPAQDVPGRIEAYDEAVRRAPHTFTYLLRSAQIHLARGALHSGAAARADERAELDLAEERIRAAIGIHPLDARARVSLAQVLVLRGDADAALAAAQRAVDLGPRHPTVQSGAVRVALDVWRRFDRSDALELALDLDALSESWQDSPRTTRDVRSVLLSRGNDALPDLLEASGGDVRRLAVAYRWTASVWPDLLPVVARALRRAQERP